MKLHYSLIVDNAGTEPISDGTIWVKASTFYEALSKLDEYEFTKVFVNTQLVDYYAGYELNGYDLLNHCVIHLKNPETRLYSFIPETINIPLNHFTNVNL